MAWQVAPQERGQGTPPEWHDLKSIHGKEDVLGAELYVIVQHFFHLRQQFSPSAVDCVGSWGECTVPCDTGTQIYTIATAATNGGTACEAAHQAAQECNTQACPGWPPPVQLFCVLCCSHFLPHFGAICTATECMGRRSVEMWSPPLLLVSVGQ